MSEPNSVVQIIMFSCTKVSRTVYAVEKTGLWHPVWGRAWKILIFFPLCGRSYISKLCPLPARAIIMKNGLGKAFGPIINPSPMRSHLCLRPDRPVPTLASHFMASVRADLHSHTCLPLQLSSLGSTCVSSPGCCQTNGLQHVSWTIQYGEFHYHSHFLIISWHYITCIYCQYIHFPRYLSRSPFFILKAENHSVAVKSAIASTTASCDRLPL